MADQDLLAKFYDIDNLVNIEIEIPEVDWDKLRKAEPHFGWRGTASWMEHPTTKEDIIKWKGHHYDWSKATSVTISGSKYPPSPGRTFKNVGIVKKSFGGSEDKTKPSIKLEFGRLSKEAKETATKAEKEASKKDEADAFALVGASGVTLNNSKQDKSFIRQPLGYEIFRQGGIPYFRCNLAKVIISGPSAADPKVKKQLLQGVFVNVEQAKEPFLRRAFNNDKGNLYETEAWFDLTRESWDKTFNQEGFSGLKNQADLKVAIEQFDKPVAEAKKVIDVEQISRVLALQALIKHW